MMGGIFESSRYAFSPYAIPLFLTATATFLLGMAGVVRERASRISLLFSLVPLTLDVWLGCFALMFCAADPGVARVWATAAHAGIPLIPAAIYQFSVAVTLATDRRRTWVWGSWLLSVLFATLFLSSNVLMDGLYHYSWGYYPRYRLAALSYCLVFVGQLILSLREHLRDSRTAQSRTHRLRSRSYLLAFAVAALGCVDYVPAYGIPVYPFGYLPVLVFVALIAATIRRYRMADITPAFAAPQILSTMADALIVYDEEGRIRLLNQAAGSLLGRAEAELAGLPVTSLVDDSAPDGGPLRAALERGEARDQAGAFRAGSGDRIEVSVSISPLREMGGLGSGAVLIARDLRERRAAAVAQLRVEENLRGSEAKFRALAETEAAAVFILQGDTFRYVNPGLQAMTGRSEGELRALRFWELAHPDFQERFRALGLAGQRAGARPDRFELRLASPGGEPRWADVTITPVEVDGRPAAVATAFDISERRLAEEALRESERRLRDILDNVQLISLLLNLQGEVTYANEYLLTLVGCTEEEILGQNWFQMFIPEDQAELVHAAFFGRIESGTIPPHDETDILTRAGERRRISWSNTVLRNPEGEVIGAAFLGADITERARAEKQLAHGALHDALTGLPNRTLLMDRLETCIARARRRPGYLFASLLLDVDRFKVVNESLGHLAGDQLLVQIARRLETCLRPADSVARLGGDEFAVLIDEIEEAAVPTRVAERIQGSLRAPFDLGGREVFVSVSIGIALHKPRYQTAEDFLRDADTAMHQAKDEGRARHREFDTAMHAKAIGLLQMVNDLHRAVEREELCAHYQPIMCLRTGRVAGLEALVRWQRPGHGLVFPGDFIRVAEETGLIVPIGRWILREACRQLRSWQLRFPSPRPLMMSVNLSARQFQQPDLVSEVARTAREAHLGPGSLKLEVTESILMENPDAAAAMLAELRTQGLHVCIDDFGTGYSSLGYLLRFPANTLKIDRSFVSRMGGGSQHSEMVVRTIVGLARSLGMDVIAEGVETKEQLAQLQALDCDFVQGYHFSKPLSAEGVVGLLGGEASTPLSRRA